MFWYRIKNDISAEEAFGHLVAIMQHEGLDSEEIQGRGFKRLFRDPSKTEKEYAEEWTAGSNPETSIGCLWDGEGWVFFGKFKEK